MMVRHYEIDFNSGAALVFPGGGVSSKGDKEIIANPALYSARRGARRGHARFPYRRDPRDVRRDRDPAGAPRGSKALVDAKRAGEIEAASQRRFVRRQDQLHESAHRQRHVAGARRAHALCALDHAGGHAEALLDTWFFLAAAPPEQAGAQRRQGIHQNSIWVSPREALEGGETGRFKLPFPTTLQFDQAR